MIDERILINFELKAKEVKEKIDIILSLRITHSETNLRNASNDIIGLKNISGDLIEHCDKVLNEYKSKVYGKGN